jgi:hypothetical protein
MREIPMQTSRYERNSVEFMGLSICALSEPLPILHLAPFLTKSRPTPCHVKDLRKMNVSLLFFDEKM